jgi:hypothetical protein
MLELTRDGSRLVYVGPGESTGSRLWVKDRERYEATPVPGTENVQGFTVSPDGEWIAFVVNGKLKKVPISGGAAVTVADSAFISGTAWLDDGTIVYTSNSFKLMRVSDAAGPSSELVDLTDSQRLAGLPTPLPRARGVIFTACAGICVQADLWVCDLESGKARQLVSGVLKGWYLPSGHLMYVSQDGEMFAGRFDPKSLEFAARLVPIRAESACSTPSFQWSPCPPPERWSCGRQSFGERRGLHEMVWVDRAAGVCRLTGWTFRLTHRRAMSVGASPDGTRLAIGLNTTGDDLWLSTCRPGRCPA